MDTHGWFESAIQDVRYAVRTLLAAPTFSLVAILTLGLGIGATTAIFSAVNAALLRPLPYAQPDQLVSVRTRLVDGRVTTGLTSAAEMGILSRMTTVVDRVTGHFSQPFDASLVRDDGTPVSISVAGISEGFFETIGLPMALGRSFTHEEHVPAGRDAPLLLVVSDAAWARLFGRDPAIVGKAIRVAELTVGTTVIGVAAPQVDLPLGADFWFNGRSGPDDTAHVFDVLVRLKPGATLDQLRAGGSTGMKELARTVPSADGREWVMRPLVTFLVGDLGPVLLIVLAATALLLALASVNVTNLLLARGMVRTREMALRSALGADRGRIVRQLLTESLVLAAAGAVLGFALAAAAVRVLFALGGSSLPRLESVPLDGTVLLFGVGVLVVCGLVTGILPAWRLARTDVRMLLNDSTRTTSAGAATSRVMSGLIVAEIAMAIALVAGAGWLVQSFSRLRNLDPGFVTAGRLVVDVRPTRTFQNQDAALAWSTDLLNRVRQSVPGGRIGASAGIFPLRGNQEGTLNVELDGEPVDPNHIRGARLRFVTPGYFDAMGIKLIAGRPLTDDDRQTSQKVAVVNRAFVRQYYPDRDPLTGAFATGYPTVDRKGMMRIVGVVDDVRFTSLAQADESAYYVPSAQAGFPIVRPAIVVAAPDGNPEALISPLRETLQRFDGQLVVKFATAPSIVSKATARQELGMTLMLVFGAMALLLAAVGIYGVLAYVAEQRRTELATRLALGAPASHVFRMMLAAGLTLALGGVMIGLGVAYAGGRVVASYVYAMRAADPLVLTAAAALVGAVTVAATLIPAIRASRLNPARALRSS